MIQTHQYQGIGSAGAAPITHMIIKKVSICNTNLHILYIVYKFLSSPHSWWGRVVCHMKIEWGCSVYSLYTCNNKIEIVCNNKIARARRKIPAISDGGWACPIRVAVLRSSNTATDSTYSNRCIHYNRRVHTYHCSGDYL